MLLPNPERLALARMRGAIERVDDGLPVLLDPEGDALRAWHARGIPTTLLIDREGRTQARVEGPADWADPAAIALVKKLVLS